MDSEQLLFLLYTSRHHRQAEGHHAHHGRLPHPGRVHPQVRVRPAPETDVYWCTADVGWVTGHSYIVYGPLANGARSVMYEGVPNFPGNDRLCRSSRSTGHQVLHGADGHPNVHEVGRR
jgi:acetyl-CoA synthetase